MKKLILFCIIIGSSVVSLAQISVLSPSNGNVGQYELIEFSVEVPLSIQGAIHEYFNPSGGKTAPKINPYDPEDIDVIATFSCGNKIEKINGFYYRQYNYSTNPVVESTTWVESPLSNNWRVRFAPKITGNWHVTLKISCGESIVYEDNIGCNFICVESNNPGFLKIDENNKYLETSSGESIFPIGMNIAWPRPEEFDSNNTIFCPIENVSHRTRIKKLSNNGGNFLRIMFVPYSFLPEWNHLNDYDDRQNLMWEMDNLLNQLRDDNVYVHIELLTHSEGLTNHNNTTYAYNWDYNPYKTLNGVNDPVDFFTAEVARKEYKKLIRYIIARWGYSTQIASFGLLNESILLSNNPSAHNYVSDQVLVNWHTEISDYIKNELSHTDHLLSGYAVPDYQHNIGSVSNLDFVTRHHYNHKANSEVETYNALNFLLDRFQKPVLFAEVGAAHYAGINPQPNPEMSKYMDYFEPTHHNHLWSSAMSGSCVPGLEWWEINLDYDCYIDNIKQARTFFNDCNLKDFNPNPCMSVDENDLYKIETFVLQNNNSINSDEFLGWTHNNSYYWYNFVQNSSSSYYNPTLAAAYQINETVPGYTPSVKTGVLQNTEEPVEYVTGEVNINNVKEKQYFGIEWYRFNEDKVELFNVQKVSSNSNGELNFTTPMMYGHYQDFAFKIKKCRTACSVNDRIEVAQLGDEKKKLVLNNRCNLINNPIVNGAIGSLNLSTHQLESIVYHGIDEFIGWMDDSDEMFVGDVNGDGIDEMILINTSYNYGAIRVVNISTGETMLWINHGTFGGWMDASDRMFLGCIDNVPGEDLVLVNTSGSYGAIRTINLVTGEDISWINHGTFDGWMDATDKMFLGNVDDNPGEDLVFVNTDGTYGAIRAIDLVTGQEISWINHGTFGGWMDASDRMFFGDINNDDKEDLVLLNTSYSGGAISAYDIKTGALLAWLNHGQFDNWMDVNDKILLEDIDNDNKDDLIFINSSGGNDGIRVFDILGNQNIRVRYNLVLHNYIDCNDRVLVGDFYGNQYKDLVFINSDVSTSNTGKAILGFDVSSNSFHIFNSSYLPSNLELEYWVDGTDHNSICNNVQAPIRTKKMLNVSEKSVSSADVIEVIPNPNAGMFKIKYSGENINSKIEIYNMLGKMILSTEYNGESVNVDLKAYDAGIYLIKMTVNNNIYTKRVVVQ